MQKEGESPGRGGEKRGPIESKNRGKGGSLLNIIRLAEERFEGPEGVATK